MNGPFRLKHKNVKKKKVKKINKIQEDYLKMKALEWEEKQKIQRT